MATEREQLETIQSIVAHQWGGWNERETLIDNVRRMVASGHPSAGLVRLLAVLAPGETPEEGMGARCDRALSKARELVGKPVYQDELTRARQEMIRLQSEVSHLRKQLSVVGVRVETFRRAATHLMDLVNSLSRDEP